MDHGTMITRGDVREARRLFELHCAEHKCKPQECQLRVALWLHIGKLAMLWEKS